MAAVLCCAVLCGCSVSSGGGGMGQRWGRGGSRGRIREAGVARVVEDWEGLKEGSQGGEKTRRLKTTWEKRAPSSPHGFLPPRTPHTPPPAARLLGGVQHDQREIRL